MGSKAIYLLLSTNPLGWHAGIRLYPSGKIIPASRATQGSASTGHKSTEEPLEVLGIMPRTKIGFWSVKPGQVLVRIWWEQKIVGVARLVKMEQAKYCGENAAYTSILNLLVNKNLYVFNGTFWSSDKCFRDRVLFLEMRKKKKKAD